MIGTIQILRGLAAWMVVFHHIVQVLFNSDVDNTLVKHIANKGAMGVDIFFVISGFIIYKSISSKSINASDFLMKRFKRVVPAYWFFTLLTAMISFSHEDIIFATVFDMEILLKSLFFIPVENPFGYGYIPLLTVGWTLNFEMFFYVMVFLSLMFFRSKVLIATCILISLVQISFSALGKPFDFYSDKIIYEFLMGMLVGYLYENNFLKKISVRVSFFLLAVSLVYLFLHHKLHSPTFVGIPAAIIVAVLTRIDAHLNYQKIVVKAFVKLGDYSYSTYLVHPLILSLISYAGHTFDIPIIYSVIASIPLILLSSFLSFRYIESPFNINSKRKAQPQESA